MAHRRLHAAVITVAVAAGTTVEMFQSTAVADPAVDSYASVAYQHDQAHDGDSADPSFVAPLTESWTMSLGGSAGYPLIADGRVFVTASGVPGSGSVLEARSLATGAVLWGPVTVSGTNGSVGIAYDAGQIFDVNRSGQVLAFDASTGTRNWTTQLANQWSFSSPPTAFDGTLYVGGAGSGGTLYAVDESTGSTTWTAGVENGDDSSPAVDDTGVYVSYACEQAYRFALGGTLVWHHSTACEGGGGRTAVLHDGALYVRDDAMFSPTALDISTGAALGSYAAGPAPAFDQDRMAAESGGVLTISNVRTGTPEWQGAATDYVTAPIIANDYVIEGRTDGTVEARYIQDGSLAWSGRVPASLGTPGEYDADDTTGLAEGDGTLVVPAGETLTAFAPAGDTTVTMTSGTAEGAVTGPAATFGFTSSVLNAQYVCTLDGAVRPCTSPVSFTRLDGGSHRLSVSVAYATKGAVTRTFLVDAAPPRVRVAPFASKVIKTATATARWTAADAFSGVKATQLRMRQASTGSAFPAWSTHRAGSSTSATVSVRRASTLCVSVRGEDGVGNWSNWSLAPVRATRVTS